MRVCASINQTNTQAQYRVRIILRAGNGGAIVDHAEHDNLAELMAYVEGFARSRGLATLAVTDTYGADVRKGDEVCTRNFIDMHAAYSPVVGHAVLRKG